MLKKAGDVGPGRTGSAGIFAPRPYKTQTTYIRSIQHYDGGANCPRFSTLSLHALSNTAAANESVEPNVMFSSKDRPICDYEGSTYRTDFWEGQPRAYEDLAERLALARLLPPSGRRLLDLGAGFGRLAAMYDGYDQVVLVDYSLSQLEYARGHLGDERFVYVAADIYRLPLATDAVDTTVMVRVLHHLVDVAAALRQVARVTRGQGAFVLEFANKRHLKNILRHLIGRGTNPFDLEPYQFANLHYDLHPAWVERQLLEAGFEIDERLSVSLFRLGILKRVFRPETLAAVDGALQRVTAPLALGPSIFVRSHAAKPETTETPGQGRLFRCPDCGHEPLYPAANSVRCDRCGASWPIHNGVYVFK